MKYTNKPVTIEAIQFLDNPETISELSKFIGVDIAVSYYNPESPTLEVETPKGYMTAQVGDWIIKGKTGWFTITKSEIFEATFSPAIPQNNKPVSLTFGNALEALKRGHRVARQGWNGKGMFLFLLPASDGLPTKIIHDPALRAVIESELGGDTFDALGSIRMFTADKKILTGWLASQTDMLSDDWMIVE